jgi:hypothetical protein
LECPDRTIPGTEHHGFLTIQDGYGWRAVRRVVGQWARAVHPLTVARLLVERHEPMSRLGIFTPIDRHGTHDDQVIANHGKICTATIGAQETELFVQHFVP